MATCPRYISRIRGAENIGDSLFKINNNFRNLQNAICSMINRIDTTVEVRTFFYYGPNVAPNPQDGTSNMQDQIASYPRNGTIENFVNGSNDLNLLPISKRNDEVYIIYQKTGFKRNQATRTVTGTVVAAKISFSQVVGWSAEAPNFFDYYSPVFIIWKLVHNGTVYRVDPNFPKFVQAETSSTTDWKTPQNWNEYDFVQDT